LTMTDTKDLVLCAIADRVAVVTINRADKLNALDGPTRQRFLDVMNQLRADDDVRVVVVTGAGDKAFVAGADVGEFEGRTAIDQYRLMNEPTIFDCVDEFPKPVIAMLNGFTLGGGCELAMACDIRIASAKAKLGQPEINLGILPGGGGTQRLPRLVGMGTAYKLLFTGQIIKADEALRIGLVDEVVPPEELRARVMALAGAIAEKSPVALRLMKQAVRASVRAPLDEGLRLETTLFGVAFASDDKNEGVAAFLEKRAAEFKGR
jgi:enoyl-CoA hydratase